MHAMMVLSDSLYLIDCFCTFSILLLCLSEDQLRLVLIRYMLSNSSKYKMFLKLAEKYRKILCSR